MTTKIDPYALRINARCPKCGKPAELHNYPASKNGGHGSRSYIHKVRRGMMGMREILESCDLQGDIETIQADAERAADLKGA